jgi:hypothetical protein
MFSSTSLPYRNYGKASRLRAHREQSGQLTLAELAILIAGGALAATAVAFLHLQVRIPGRVVFFAALPIVLGVAIVPRRFAGTISGNSAALSCLAFLGLGVGRLQPASVTSLLAVGPAIDLALSGARAGGWSLYLRFAMAGLASNLLAFVVRWLTAYFRIDGNMPHRLPAIDTSVPISFAACGFLAGVLCAVICFRRSSQRE